MKPAAVPEFSRLVGLEELEEGEVSRKIEASAEERRALADRFDLLAIDALAASLRLWRLPDGPLVRVEGRLAADVVQRCVVTLAPLPAHIDEEVAETFGPPGYRAPDGDEDGDVPEVFEDSGIDVGELVAQLLLLALAPYPRAAGAGAPDRISAGEEGGDRSRPFAGLGEMMQRHRK
jgi:uncharacterized metal-binding protein YceD (DUF177 family)